MQDLLNLIDKVSGSGTFSVGGTLPSIPAGLTVKTVGNIGLPLTENQAQALIEFSEQAPFGRREETIVDTNVRKSWQISAEDFELTNPAWEGALQKAVNQIGKDLGLAKCKIGFEQYKLLVYEEGSFFASHRDTEKIPNMFATLVVNLPSEHEGGELIISHAGQSESYSFADSSLFEPSFVAFYADCYHEVKPITSGYRLCLVYNLAITNRKKQPALAQQMKEIEGIDKAIQEWSQEAPENPILTYLLEHSYSEQNLSLSNLKHGDFAKASVLLNAAEKSGCQAYLCLATYYRTSYGEVESYGYGRYSYNDDSDDDLDESDFEEYDVDEESVYAHAFIAADGSKIDVKKLHLDEDELLAKTPLMEGPGRGYSISEATGNEGATKDLWYHRGAVIMWPKDRELDLVAQMDVDYGIHVLKKSLHGQKKLADQTRQQLIRLADHLVEKQSYFSREDISAELMQLADIELLKKSLFKFTGAHSFRVDPETFVKVAERFGWKHFANEVSEGLKARGGLYWLDTVLPTDRPLSHEGQSIMTRWVTSLWEAALTYRPQPAEISHLVRLVSVLKIEPLPDEIIAFLAKQTEQNFLTEAYGPALVSTQSALAGQAYDKAIMGQFVDDIRQRIQATFPSVPEPPQDWAREGQLDCVCEFCTEVNAFLPDPDVSQIGIYKTLKRNLTHVESKAEERQIDLDVAIRKTPPKFNGTIRKNQARYERQRILYNAAQNILSELKDGL